jgi:hypothetical protein
MAALADFAQLFGLKGCLAFAKGESFVAMRDAIAYAPLCTRPVLRSQYRISPRKTPPMRLVQNL